MTGYSIRIPARDPANYGGQVPAQGLADRAEHYPDVGMVVDHDDFDVWVLGYQVARLSRKPFVRSEEHHISLRRPLQNLDATPRNPLELEPEIPAFSIVLVRLLQRLLHQPLLALP